MRYHHYTKTLLNKYPVCFLVPLIRADEIEKAYLTPYSLDPGDIIVIDLHQKPGTKKTPKSEIVQYITQELVPTFEDLSIEYIVVADAEYFKALTKKPSVDVNLGYVLDSAYGPQKVVYVPNYRAMFYDPEKITSKISQGITALNQHRQGIYEAPGEGVLRYEEYPKSLKEIKAALVRLLEMQVPLAIDIEAFSLKHHDAGIGTISFSWSKHEGIAFAVDYAEIPWATEAPFGVQAYNKPVRALLKWFFNELRQKAIYHNISYDVYVLIYQLFMRDILDTDGLLEGMDTLLRNWDDTKLITYLATNSCSGNSLGLKDQAQEFAGNYAMGEDIKDIRNIPLNKLLRYNLIDSCSTWFVHEKHYDQMVADEQLEIYETIFKPATLDIIQMQLTGMPINKKRTREVRWLLYKDRRAALKKINESPVVKEFNQYRLSKYVDEMNKTWVKKRTTAAETLVEAKTRESVRKEIFFNPASDPQLRTLLYDLLELPQIDFTDSKMPATGAKTLEKLLNHTDDETVKAFIQAMIDYSSVDKILTSFIPAMLNAVKGPDGWHYLFGNFNLGGTLSGRLSSSDPNLQNLPAHAKGNKDYGKLIKTCFEAPPGWVFVGLDFASLEDKISGLTTKDPNKLKVYTDGYDGHSLRTFSYFREKMIGIIDTVDSINSIAVQYKHERFLSKAPTFALTYQGTYKTLMNNCGFSEELAKTIEARYKELYKVSIDWVSLKLDEASKRGYIIAAFGLRVRTPLLHQVIRGTKKTPYEAEAEGRSAGNALGQSWCLLNNRAASEFMGKVRKSQYRTAIRPCAQIHDAQYYLMPDDMGALAYTNIHLVEAVKWQDHPDIYHDQVKLGGEVSIFYPNWSEEIIIPNDVDEEGIMNAINKALEKQAKKKESVNV